MAARLLDGGALGIIMPHIDSVAQAQRFVEMLRFPPLGIQSVYGGMPQFGFEALPVAEASKALNSGTLLIAMIESEAAVADASAIAAVPGIDVLFIGANDLRADLGIDSFVDPLFERAVEQTMRAGQHNNCWVGIGGLYDETMLSGYIAAGMRFVLTGSDISFALARAKDVVDKVRPINLTSQNGHLA
jgi:2-keto-3-deoxy-L-rhamnonate aldolase RhmA